MDNFDIQNCLDSMSVLVDTREQPSERSEQRLASLGCPYKRQKLNYGDYTYNFILPNGQSLFTDEKSVDGHAIIERKMNLEELSQCFCQSRDRFVREFERIKAAEASSYLLIEDGNYEKLIHGRYKTKYNSQAYLASLTAWMARYNTHVIFCQHEISGKLIREILYRELKERLEQGVYG